METVCLLIFVAALAGILSFATYPLALWSLAGSRTPARSIASRELPLVSLITVVRNGEHLVAEKIRNGLDLDYPPDRLELILFSDGSSDDTAATLERLAEERVSVSATAEHRGKFAAMNDAAEQARGEVLVFSDTDAILERDAVSRLVDHFADPAVGGVCGQRKVPDAADTLLASPQRSYVGLDSSIKAFESRLGSVTSNDGKLYAIRRTLYEPVPPAVTDDLFVLLTVVSRGFRFLFEPAATAAVRLPSLDPAHELSRRRRIVSRSLRALWIRRQCLNPFRHGAFALGLLVNKVVRRLLPVSLLALLLSSLCLSVHRPTFRALLVLQLGFYLSAAAYPIWRSALRRWPWIDRQAARAFYFCLGSWGMLLGTLDLVTGRRIERWEPAAAPPPEGRTQGSDL